MKLDPIVIAAKKFFTAHREDYDECLGSNSLDIDVEFMALGDAILKDDCLGCNEPGMANHAPDCPENRK